MNRRFLHYYTRELQHVRGMAAEFAAQYPRIAGRLAIDERGDCTDPYVERLLEGQAFLAARVQLKIDAEFPRFTQSLLETVFPHYLSPTPSMALVQFRPDLSESALAEGYRVPRGTRLRSTMGPEGLTPCLYQTAHETVLWPVRIADVRYVTRDMAALGIPAAAGAQAALHIRLETPQDLPFSQVKLEALTFHIQATGEKQMRLYEQMVGGCQGVIVRPPGARPGASCALGPDAVRPVGLGRQEALLPYDARSFQGYRLLHEYFAFPQRFMFVQIGGLGQAVRQCAGGQLDIILLMKQADLHLESTVEAADLALFCTPSINLFPKQADWIPVTDRFSEFQVIPDRTRGLDYEVYRVMRVAGQSSAQKEQEFLPFYAANDFQRESGGGGAYYAVHRVSRVLSERERQLGRPTYAGSEVYLSLVDVTGAPYRADLRQLGVAALCTNRDLPLRLTPGRGNTDFVLDLGAPVESVRCIGRPSPPRASWAEGEVAWRAVSHLALNYASLADTEGGKAAAALQDILRLYSHADEPQVAKQIAGIGDVACRPITRRAPTPGPITFARGLEVTVTLDDAAFEGTGVYLLGMILARFFAQYVSINSFTETVLRTVARGEVKRWGATLGHRPIL